MPPRKSGTGSNASAACTHFPKAPSEVQASIDKLLKTFDSRSNSSDPYTMLRRVTSQMGDDPEALRRLVDGLNSIEKPDISKFDFSVVRVKKESFWVLQIMHIGFQDRNGKVSEQYFDGAQPIFQVIVYDDKTSWRIMEQVPKPGMPSSEFLLTCVKKAIVSPLPPLKPSLPEILLARKLRPHERALKPFLDSLPKPFHWRIETAEEAEEVADGVDACNKKGVVQGLKQAEAQKTLGNQAIKQKQRNDAVKHYSNAVECLQDAWSQKPTDSQAKEIKNLMSVCLCNRAAAWLMDGAGQDAKRALKDADKAIERDPSYNKAYYRAVKAHQILSETDKAVKALISSLSRKDLANDSGLIEALINIYGGLPNNEKELRKFCAKFKNPVTGKDVAKLAGFRTRINREIQDLIGPYETIDTI